MVMTARGSRGLRLIGLGALILLGWHAVLFAAAAVLPASPDAFPTLTPTLVNLAAAVVPLVIVWRRRWWRSAAFAWRRPDRTWLLLLPLLVPLLVDGAGGIAGSAGALAASGVMLLAVGWSEESVNRGVVQRVLMPLGAVRSCIVVGLLFGAGHALSGAWFGRPWDATETIVVDAAAFGFLFAALRWHLGTIWPLAAAHAVVDFVELNSPGAQPLVLHALVDVFQVAYGVVLLRLLVVRRRAPIAPPARAARP